MTQPESTPHLIAASTPDSLHDSMPAALPVSHSTPDLTLDPAPARPLSGSIAVIGVSGRYPGGANSPDLLWQALSSGRDAVSEARGDRWSLGWHHPDTHRQGRVYTRAGGFLDAVDGFDAEFFGLSPREARQMDPQQRLLLELAWEAHEDAGIAPRSRSGSDTGVFIGISSNDYASLDGAGWPDAYSNTGSSFSIAANRISYIFDFHGPSVAVDTACSSSIVCVHQACMSLLAGECSTALAGGVSILTHIRPWLGFARASMLSPSGRCKSFDASGDGYVRSEGGGLVLLKPLAAAERDGDRILGVILASGVNSDGRTVGLSMPNGEAQQELLEKVYAQAGLDPRDIFYVEAHGTGTAVGDPIECGALGRVLGRGRERSSCLIGSVKSNIGHLEAASGIAGLTKALLILKHRQIPANLHFHTPNPKIDFDAWRLAVVTATTPLPENPVVLGINSFGFGGTNAHLALAEYRPSAAPGSAAASALPSAVSTTRSATAAPAPLPAPGLLLLSGHSPRALTALAGAWVALLSEQPAESAPQSAIEASATIETPTLWPDLCAAATTRTPLRHRLALTADSAAEAREKLERWLAADGTGTATATGAAAIPGLATGEASASDARLAFVYSGNGPQWWAMGRELLAANVSFRASIEQVDRIFAPLAGWSLLAEMARPESESRIALTEVAQPMLFALQLGLTRVLGEQGIRPQAVAGHSVGEVAAAFAAGALSLEQAVEVIFHRSREQAATAGLGRMAALGVGPEEAAVAIRAALAPASSETAGGWLEIAAVNSPQSVTVAGDPAALERLVEQLTAAGKFARVLALNYPFHTRAMEPIREGLVASLAGLAPSETTVPFVSTVTGEALAGSRLDAEYWYRNVREPVAFAQAVRQLIETHSIGVVLEIGPHPVLKDYILQTAKTSGSPVVALPTLRRPGRSGPEPEPANLATAICACHTSGATDTAALFRRPSPLPDLPLYPWQRERHWRGKVALPDIFTPIDLDHPLLGHRLPAIHGLWENPVDLRQLPYLGDHVVQEAVLFPAAGYIELALAAGRLLYNHTPGEGTLVIENFEVLRPLAIPAHLDPLVQTQIDARDGTIEISSRADRDATEWTVHVRGRLSRVESRGLARSETGNENRSETGSAHRNANDAASPDASPAPANPAPSNLAEIAARLPHAVSSEEHYAGARSRGLAYGATFQGVGSVLVTAREDRDRNPQNRTTQPLLREALAEIRLPALSPEELAPYQAHPALLDSCIQVLITLIAQNDPRPCSTIPVQLGRVTSFAPLTSSMFCQVTMVSESERSAVADFRILDADGRLLMTIDEARCQKVDFHSAGATPLTSEWWRLDPHSPELRNSSELKTLPALPAPSETAARVAAQLARIEPETLQQSLQTDLRPELDRLARAYAIAALAGLLNSGTAAAGARPGSAIPAPAVPESASFDLARLARAARIRREQTPLLSRLLEIALEDGQIEPVSASSTDSRPASGFGRSRDSAAGVTYRWNHARTPEDPALLWRELFRAHPAYQAELLVALERGESLSARLRSRAGEPGAPESATGTASDSHAAPLHLLEQLGDTAPSGRQANRLARAALEALLAHWPLDRPIRILQIAGELSGQSGSGSGLAAWLLPLLPPERTDYLFTDPSAAALARAEHRLAAHRFVRFATLDLTHDLGRDLSPHLHPDGSRSSGSGLPSGYFDLILGRELLAGAASGPASAASGPADAQALLARLRPLLAPGGQLLLIEPAAANPGRFRELLLGLPAGLPLSPAEFAAAGFAEAVQLSERAPASAQSTDHAAGQAVWLAQLAPSPAPAKAQIADPAPLLAEPPAAGTALTAARHWLLAWEDPSEAVTFGRELAARLTACGHQVTLATGEPDALARLVNPVSPVRTADPAETSSAPIQVVYLAAAPPQQPEITPARLLEIQQARSLAAIALVEALERGRQSSPVALTLVTRGALPTAQLDPPLDPGQAALWGLGRVIANEHPGLNLRLIDLHTQSIAASALDESTPAASTLAEELLRLNPATAETAPANGAAATETETEVQLVRGYRYLNRERLTNLADQAREAGSSPAERPAYALDFEPRGGLDSLHLREALRRDPAPHEVEIAVKAAGLNFRDVLWTMGMLAEEAVEHGFSGPTIGMECAGVIVRTGAAVTGLKPGDRVVAFASSCFASHVTTSAASVALLPDGIAYAAAATIPTAFLTAWYAFDYLARLEAGETVLIHGAAGGVGLAAIQIARLKGAKVIGTAGSPRKRRMLELLGVEHVLDSRSLEFAAQVRELTGGQGVDVVLNSLAGEAIPKSLDCLRPFGRFLEIGKRDLYANSRIGLRPFRNNLSYYGIDADTLLIGRPQLAQSLFRTILDHFRAGLLHPLPFQAVPISRAAEAFRAMQQSRHVGKLVVSTELDRPGSLAIVRTSTPIRAGVTYLVTGGLGGFGLSTALWLAEQGARSLALLSRRGATTEEAREGLARLEALGVHARAFAVDIAELSALSRVLETIAAEMAPLAGVFHSAAVIEDAPILSITAEQLDRVYRPKLVGAWNLHTLTLPEKLGRPLDLFVLYSSSSAVVGNPGQGAYVAANLYLDALALYRHSLGLPALSVGWGAIKDAGFLTRHQAVAGMLKARTGLDATPAEELLADLGRLLAVGATRVSVARFDLQKLAQMLPGARVPRFVPIVPKGAAAALESTETLADLLPGVPLSEQLPLVLARVLEHAARVLGTSAAQVPVDQPLANLGLDSLMAVELAGGLERDLGRPISVMQMLSATSLTAIAQLVLKLAGGASSEPAGPTAAQPAGIAVPSEAQALAGVAK